MSLEVLERLAVALAVGLLIGLERGWEQRELPEGERVAGLRTYGLLSVLGCVAVVLAGEDAILFAAIALSVGFVLAIGYFRQSRRTRRQSATGAIAAILTFTLGAMAGRGLLVPAAVVAVVVALILGFKPELHDVLRRIERDELLATLRLLLISVVVLPILPDRGFGPWHALDPYRMWWMVVVVAGVSYVGYVAQRLWGGEWGLVASALFGGLASSTAVTVDLARRSTSGEDSLAELGAATVGASSLMFFRMLVILAVLAPALVVEPTLTVPLCAAGVAGFAATGLLALGARGEAARRRRYTAPSRNPLDLRAALEFGLVLAVVIVLSRGLRAWLGDRGLYLGAAAAGLADVDALILSVAEMSHDGGQAAPVAILAILIAATVNTAVKVGIAAWLGRSGLGARVALGLSFAIGAELAAYFFLFATSR